MNWSNSNTYTIKASKIGAYLSGIIFSYSPIFSFWSRIHCFLLSSLRRSSPGSLGGKESTCNVGDPGSIPGLGKIPWRRKGQPSPVFLPVKSYGQRSMVGYSPWCLQRAGHDWVTFAFYSSLLYQVSSVQGICACSFYSLHILYLDLHLCSLIQITDQISSLRKCLLW